MAEQLIKISVIPKGGGDRVVFNAHDVVFGQAKADKTNNALRIGEKAFDLNTLQWDITAAGEVVL